MRLLVKVWDFCTQDVRLDVPPGETIRYVIRLERGRSVYGRIESPAGEPLDYAFVRLLPEKPGPLNYFFTDGYEVKTGEDGRYAFAGLDPGRYRLEARHFMHRPGFQDLEMEAEDLEVSLRVKPLHEVELTFELADGAPLPDMFLLRQNGEAIHPDHSDLRFDRLCRGLQTYEMGEYVLLENGRGTLRYHEGQRYVLLTHEGYAPFIRKIDPATQESLHVRLERGRSLAGVVVDEAGVPIPNAAVLTVEAFFTCEHRVTTDADGGFVIPDLPQGPYEVYVWAEGYPERVFHVAEPAEGARVRQVLSRGDDVEGEVLTKRSRPAPSGTRVTVLRADEAGTFQRLRTASSDEQGRFRVVLDPGRDRFDVGDRRSRDSAVLVVGTEPARVRLTLPR